MTTPDIALASDGKSLITSVGTQDHTVWVHDKDGDHQVTSEGNATSPKFSLDGRSLYFLVTSGQAHKQELWVRDLASGKMDKVLPDYSMQDYAISPDGKKVAFVMKDVTLNEDGELVDRGSFRTNPSSVDKWFTDLPRVWIAMEAGTHSIWISEQLQEFAHEVIVAKRARAAGNLAQWSKSDQVDAEKLARFARLDPKILRPIAHRTVAPQEALTLIRARNLIVRLRTAAVNAARGLGKPCGYRLPASSTLCFAKRCGAVLPPGLARALGPVLHQIADMTVKVKKYDRAIKHDRDGISRNTGAPQGLWSGPAHAFDVCLDSGKQRTFPTKSRCGLLSRPAAETESVRRARPSAPPRPAGGVCQSRPRAAWKGLNPATVGPEPGVTRRQAIVKSCHRRRGAKARCAPASHLDHTGTEHSALCKSRLRKKSCSTIATTPCSDDCVSAWASTRPTQDWQHRFLLLNPKRHRAITAHAKYRIETQRTTCVATNAKNITL